jgi:hypothetical protein
MSETIWTSPPRQIGKHEWRIRQYRHERYGVLISYEWRGPNAPAYYPADYWHDMEQWPTYDHNDGPYSGCPRSLRALWEDHRAQLDANKASPTFRTELTPAGEQTVIPGCERNASPKATQLDLF